MSTLAAITIGFIAIIAIGTTAAWIHDLLEVHGADLAARARVRLARSVVRAGSGRARSGLLRRLGRTWPDDHRRRAPVYRHATGTRRTTTMPTAAGDRILRS